MSKDLSRRKFLEKIGFGTAAGTGFWLLKDVAHAGTAALPSRTLGRRAPRSRSWPSDAAARFLMYEEEDKALAGAESRPLTWALLTWTRRMPTETARAKPGRAGDGVAAEASVAGHEDSGSHARRIHEAAGG